VNQAINHLRHQWLGLRVGGPGATMRGHWTLLAVCMTVVFAAFFAIGRVTRGGAAAGSRAEAPAAVQSSSGQAAIPSALSGGSPTAGAVPVDIVPPPRPRHVTQAQPRTRAPVAEAPAATLTTPTSTVQPAVSQSRAAAPVETAPAPAPSRPVQQAAAPSHAAVPSHSQSSSGGGGGEGGGGASFDSSE
jgi:hypothetical protein